MDNSYKRRRFINYGHVCVMPLSICLSPQTVHVTCARDNDLLKLFLDIPGGSHVTKKEMMQMKTFFSESKGLKNRI